MRFAKSTVVRRLVSGLVVGGALVVSACSSSDETPSSPSACTDIGSRCTTDEGCCTGNCMWQGDGAYCQNTNVSEPPCSTGGAGCTQNRHCCSKTCNAGTCTRDPGDPTRPPGSCSQIGTECRGDDECCSRTCTPDQAGTKSFCTE